DKIVVMSEGKIQQTGTPEDIYNEPKNAFVADFIGESNIFSGIMTGKFRVRFCGAEFACVDDVEHGTMIDAVVRPEDVIITTPEKGTVKGKVTSVIFKGVHYEITVLSGKNEIVVQSTKKAEEGSEVGILIEPEGIHIMLAEDVVNRIETGLNKDYSLQFLDGVLSCDLTELFPNASYNSNGVLVDAHGDVIDAEAVRIIVSVKPECIEMSDDKEAGLLCGHIINLIYKGDHYSYVVRTDEDEDFIVDDEYLWNMDDYVSLIIPKESFEYAVKK
ncbi:MAG: TOBE domain-containing protein, partial [Lachnospiraceae bacterium]|nr:TOBE domain-containing protein [Lachnospiraceae bacterium]